MLALWAQNLTKTFHPTLRLGDLLRGSFKPSGSPTRALDQVDLHVNRGEVVGLLGPNGAGKTTLLKTLATLVLPDEGEGWVAGNPLTDEDGVRQAVGLMTSDERSFYWRLTGRENLRFFASMHGIDAGEVDKRLSRLEEVLRLAEFIDKRFDAYSSGMKQRLALARSLLHRPRVLLLDEPTRSVDPVESQALRSVILDLVHEEKTAVVVVTHNLRELETLCRRVLVLRGGSVVFDDSVSHLRRQMGGRERYRLGLEDLVEDWRQVPGIIGGELVGDEKGPEIAVDISPDSSIGDVVVELHSRGARIDSVRPEADALERALEALETSGSARTRPEVPKPVDETGSRRPVSRFAQIAAFLRRDLRIQLSYRFAFAIGFFGIVFNVAVFFFLSRLVDGTGIPGLGRYGSDFFPFILIGIAFRGYLGVALLQFSNALRSEQMMGTLEALLVSPVKVSTLLTASTSYTFLSQTVTVVGYLILGLAMGSLSLGRMNLPLAATIMIPTVATFAAIGMLSASFHMTFKRGDPINFFINAAATLFGGVFFPIEVLPDSLQFISKILPITYSLTAMRKALLTGAELKEVGSELMILTAFAVFLVPAGLAVFNMALRKARRDGSLGQF